MIQLLPGLRIKVSNKHSTYGRVKVKSIQLFLGKYNTCGYGYSGYRCFLRGYISPPYIIYLSIY